MVLHAQNTKAITARYKNTKGEIIKEYVRQISYAVYISQPIVLNYRNLERDSILRENYLIDPNRPLDK